MLDSGFLWKDTGGRLYEHGATDQPWLSAARTFLGLDHACDRQLDNGALARLDRAISGKVEPWLSHPATDARMDQFGHW